MEELKLEDLMGHEIEKLGRFCFDFISLPRPDQGYRLYDVEERLEELSLVEQNPNLRDCYVLTKKGVLFVFENICDSDDKAAFADRFKEVFGESVYADEWNFEEEINSQHEVEQEERTEAEKEDNDGECIWSWADGLLKTGCEKLMNTVINYEKFPERYPDVCPFCKKRTARKLEEEPCLGEPIQGTTPEVDMVNSPAHYTNGDIECIDAMEASMSPIEFIGHLKGTAFASLWRYQHKGGVEDIDKCIWYLKLLKKKYKKHLKQQKKED